MNSILIAIIFVYTILLILKDIEQIISSTLETLIIIVIEVSHILYNSTLKDIDDFRLY